MDSLFAGIQPVGPTKVIRWPSGTLATDGSKETWTKRVGFRGIILAADVATLSGSPGDEETTARIEIYDIADRAGAGILLWRTDFVEKERTQPTPRILVESRWVLELETWNFTASHVLQAAVAVMPVG